MEKVYSDQHLYQFHNHVVLIAIFNNGRAWLGFDEIARKKSCFIEVPGSIPALPRFFILHSEKIELTLAVLPLAIIGLSRQSWVKNATDKV